MTNETTVSYVPASTSNKRRKFAAGVAVALLIALVVGFAGRSGGARSATPTSLDWGLYQILWSRSYPEKLRQELDQFASKPAYVMFYRDLGRPFPTFPIDSIARHGATAIISLELWRWGGGRDGSYLPAIVAGAYDEFFTKWAQDAKSHGRRVLLRFGFEFNGDWFTWSGDAESYVGAWRRVHDIFAKVGADNVEWLWTPNVQNCPDTHEYDMHRYFPGDRYVDWVGIDGYNFGDNHDEWHKWQSFDEVFGEVLADFQTRYGDKPMMIAEFGCAPGKGGQREAWIRAAYESLAGQQHVRAAIWFNYDKRREGEPNWRVDATPDSLRAFNETFAAGNQ